MFTLIPFFPCAHPPSTDTQSQKRPIFPSAGVCFEEKIDTYCLILYGEVQLSYFWMSVIVDFLATEYFPCNLHMCSINMDHDLVNKII
jgi:hypothetical protein